MAQKLYSIYFLAYNFFRYCQVRCLFVPYCRATKVVTFHVLVAKVHVMTGAHYVTLCEILLFVIYKPLWSVAQKLLL